MLTSSNMRVLMPLLLAVVCGVFIIGTEAKVLSGTNLFENNTKFMLLEKFCFHSDAGVLVSHVANTKGYEGQQLVFFHDIPETGFPEVYKSGSSCANKVAVAAKARMISDPEFSSDEGKRYMITGARPRWWYVVLANCENGKESLSLDSYEIEFTNGEGRYVEQFSYDEQGIFESLIVTILILLLQFGGMMFVYNKHRKQGLSGSNVLRVVLICIAIDTLAVFLQLLHYDSYASDGVGLVTVEELATFLEIFPELIIIGLFLFLAKGWQIQIVRDKRTIKQVLFLYFCASSILYYWTFTDEDHTLLLYMYQSPPGYILVILRVVSGLWFASSLQVTWRTFDRNGLKQGFYTGLGVFGLLFFFSQPFVVFVSELMDTWNRRKTVEILNHFIMYTTYFIFFVLFGLKADYIKAVGDEVNAGLTSGGDYGAPGGMEEDMEERGSLTGDVTGNVTV